MTWTERIISAEAAAQKIQSGNRIFITGNCSTPLLFTKALLARHVELHDVEVIKLLDVSEKDAITPDIAEHIRVNNLFIGPNQREAVNSGLADFTPVFLSEVPRLFQTERYGLDVAVIHISPPDIHGYSSYGVEVGVTKSAAERAKRVIAEVNPNMPRTLGDSFIHVDQINCFIMADYELPEITPAPLTDIQCQIAKYIAERIPDAATLQTGIGGIPDAVLRQLIHHRHLGVHTELFSDGVMEMIEAGVITNARKSLHPGKVVAGFVLGSRKLFQYIHDNPVFELHPTAYVNDPYVIAQNNRMVSINAAIEVDLTGQVCADSIGTHFYSGVGGQLDFVRGARRSAGGMSFIALPSTAKDGTVSRIVPMLKPGAGVTTSRNDVHMVVTEYGIADLRGLSIRERVQALVNIAHPDFREDLLRFAHEQKYIGMMQTTQPAVSKEAKSSDKTIEIPNFDFDETVVPPLDVTGEAKPAPTVSTRHIDNPPEEDSEMGMGSVRIIGDLMLREEETGKEFHIPHNQLQEVVIGRKYQQTDFTPTVDLTALGAHEKGVSRHHATISIHDNLLVIIDHNSMNGTFLKGQRLVPEQPRVVRDKDTIRIGGITLTIEYESAEDASSPLIQKLRNI